MLQKCISKKRLRCNDRLKNFHCHYCDKAYQTNDSLQTHKKNKHRKEWEASLEPNMKNSKILKTGRPAQSLKNQKNLEKSNERLKIFEEEEIWENTIILLLEIQEAKKDKNLQIICDIEEEFFNFEEAINSLKTNTLHPMTSHFLKELIAQHQKETNEVFEDYEDLNEIQYKLKQLAQLCMKSTYFLKRPIFEYFLLLNLEILEKFFVKKENEGWDKCLNLDNLKEEFLEEFPLKEMSEFSKKYREEIMDYLKV